jgi:hypothetical protein
MADPPEDNGKMFPRRLDGGPLRPSPPPTSSLEYLERAPGNRVRPAGV